MMESHEYYLRKAIEVSRRSRENGNTPFGAILVDGEGNILLEQENIEISTKKCTGHAETTLAERASVLYPKSFLWNCTLYTSAEPCAMCAGALTQSRINKVYIGAKDEKNGCVGSIANILDINTTHKVKYEYLEDTRECSLILTNFFKELRKKKK